MKKYFFLLFVLSTLIACKGNKQSSNKDSLANTTPTLKLMQRFLPIIKGVWVKKDYIDMVVKARSPLAAVDLAVGITTFPINADSVKGDTITALVGWGNHDSSNETLRFKPGKTPETIQFGSFDLGYNIANGDTTLTLYGFDTEKHNPTKVTYVKALDKPAKNLGDGLDYLINKGLFAGNYKLIDSIGTHDGITFTAKGKVNGLADFKTYTISDDLLGEPMNNLDDITFTLPAKHYKSFTFKFNADTLSLFTTKANGDSTLDLVDKLAYKLVRVK